MALKNHAGPRTERAFSIIKQERRSVVAKAKAKEFFGVPDKVAQTYDILQNGSDIRGVALAGVAGEPVTLSSKEAFFIATGFAEWLVKEKGNTGKRLTVSIGRDPRLSGKGIVAAIVAGMTSMGVETVDMGLATTPACFMSTITEGHEYDGSMMCTASHLPWNRNGVKFFTSAGGLKKPDIKFILEAAALNSVKRQKNDYSPDNSMLKKIDFLPVYSAGLREMIKKGVNHLEHYDTPLKGIKIVVDAGNGSGGFFASQVLEPLGAHTDGSQFLYPDGNFPNHVPNPEDARAMQMTADAVKRVGADLGVVFDTDVDRSGMVDSTGLEINKNRLIALLAAVVLEEHPGTTIVTDSVTNTGIKAFIAQKGGKHYRYMRGYANIIAKGVELNAAGVETPLMIETSGHGAMKENHFLDDGAYLAVKIIIAYVKARLEGLDGLTGMLQGYTEGVEEREYRMGLPKSRFKEEGAKVVAAFKALVESMPAWQMEADNHEGWYATIDEGEGRQGFVIMRQSLHDPLLVLNMESYVEGGCDANTETIINWLEDQPYEVDYSKLTAPK